VTVAEPLYRHLVTLRAVGVAFEMIGDDLHVFTVGGRLSESTYRWLVAREHEVKALVRQDEHARLVGLDLGRLLAVRWAIRQGRIRDY
jgi:orotate phosphoribosyltransferase-like protein